MEINSNRPKISDIPAQLLVFYY